MTSPRTTAARWSAIGLAAATVAALTVTVATAHSAESTAAADAAPLTQGLISTGASTELAGGYIVVLKDADGLTPAAVSATAQSLAKRYSGQVRQTYTSAVRGFHASISAAQAAKLATDPAVQFVEPNQVSHAADTQNNPPSWGIDRIDQRTLPLSQSYTYNTNASNVTAYIVDSGINIAHQDFGGRATYGFDGVDGGDANDCHGHGTHVAGTVGGATFGVAKRVKLVAVRVLNCSGSGSTAGTLSAVDWMSRQPARPAVANFSIYFGSSAPSVETAIRNSINSGIMWSLSANNQNVDACNSSPAKIPEALTVGNSTSTDARSSSSNYGRCVDYFAPGSSIISATHNSNTGSRSMSGTSMAAPHSTGASALYLADNPTASSAQVQTAMKAAASRVTIGNAGSGSPNLLLYTLGFGTPSPTPSNTVTPTPTATVTPTVDPTTTTPPGTCTGYTNNFSGSLSSGGSAYQPNNSYFQTTVSGSHRACLDGPSGTDYDLYLQKWNGSAWSNVASGTSSAADETLTYSGTAGYYRYRVHAYSGSGTYQLGYNRP